MNITFKKVTFSYHEDPLLKDVDFTFTTSDKIGLVGVNGVGKSTLLKLMLNLEKPQDGEILITGGAKINYLSQNVNIPSDRSCLEYIFSSLDKEKEIKEYEARSILTKFKLDPDGSTSFLSGGQKKRLELARCLVTRCDFLILDEPTNHLDNDMIMYLEKYLIKFTKGLFMVTHDRYFLERVCNNIYELDRAKIYVYKANYTKFLELKAARQEQNEKEESRIKKILRIDHEWMTRGVEARRTKQKYRIERFKEMSKIKFQETKSFEFSSVNTYLGKKIINIKNGSKSYGSHEIFSSFSFSLLRSDHIGLVGDNGCGKTTLFKIIIGEEKLTNGEIELGETLRIGYFSQHFDVADESLRVIDYILKEANEIETLEGKISAKSLLERFLFDGKMQYSQIKTLSGGQKRRLQLVKVLSSNPNILLLDEPTNDLDIYTMEILEQYLSSFIGPLICISHDRFFLDKVCDSILYYDNKKILTYNGSFSEFLEEQNKKETQEKQEIGKKEISKEKKNNFSFKDQYELSLLEKEIVKLEKKINELNSLLGEEKEYSKIEEISSSLNKLNVDYEEKTLRYMELLEKKEK